jgi:hypothetical protein
VPELPSPPELARPLPRLLDTSPSPRFEGAKPPPLPEAAIKTQIGVEPASARGRISTPPVVPPLPPSLQGPMEAPPLPSGMRAVAAEQTAPARLPAVSSRSSASIVILVLALVAAAGAAVWFLVLRPQAGEQRDRTIAPAPGSGATGSAGTGSGVESAGVATPGSTSPDTGSAAPAAPAPEMVDTTIEASAGGATVVLADTGQSGAAPFTAKLEKGKSYQAKVTAHGFLPAEVEVKGGDDNVIVKLVAKPRVVSITSEPAGALILVDSGATGHNTPFDVELGPAQAGKKTVRVQLRKQGYRSIDRAVDLNKLVEDDTKMVVKLDEKLAVAPPISRPVTSPGSARGSAHEGSDAGSGSADDSATPPGSTQGSGSAAAQPTGSGGSATEPEPEFNKHP